MTRLFVQTILAPDTRRIPSSSFSRLLTLSRSYRIASRYGVSSAKWINLARKKNYFLPSSCPLFFYGFFVFSRFRCTRPPFEYFNEIILIWVSKLSYGPSSISRRVQCFVFRVWLFFIQCFVPRRIGETKSNDIRFAAQHRSTLGKPKTWTINVQWRYWKTRWKKKLLQLY